MAKHSMKGSAPQQGGGTLNSRTLLQRSGAPQTNTGNSPTLPNIGGGMGGGTLLSRHSVTKPSGDSGLTGPAQPLASVPAKAQSDSTAAIGPRVYKSTKPSKR